jgi:hypothetical protein
VKEHRTTDTPAARTSAVPTLRPLKYFSLSTRRIVALRLCLQPRFGTADEIRVQSLSSGGLDRSQDFGFGAKIFASLDHKCPTCQAKVRSCSMKIDVTLDYQTVFPRLEGSGLRVALLCSHQQPHLVHRFAQEIEAWAQTIRPGSMPGAGTMKHDNGKARHPLPTAAQSMGISKPKRQNHRHGPL